MRIKESEYIVDLTKQLVTQHTLSALQTVNRGRSQPTAWYLFLRSQLSEKVSGMTDETLGRICGYGYTKNLSEPLDSSSGFIFKTGIESITPHDYSAKISGRELLKEIAIRTIVAVACDIIMQPDYEEARRLEKDVEEQYDRGMRDYLHRGNK